MIVIERLVLGRLDTNCYILYNKIDNNTVIIDPAADFETIDKYLIDKDLLLDSVILTHGHFDHIEALSSLVNKYNPRIIINKFDKDLLSDASLNLSLNFFGKDVTVKSDKIVLVEDDNKLLIDNIFTFIHTPGHTPGSMCVKIDDNLFTGDTLFYHSIGNAFPPYGDVELEIESIISKLLTYNKNLVCYPGHGQSTTLDEERKNNPYLTGGYYGY